MAMKTGKKPTGGFLGGVSKKMPQLCWDCPKKPVGFKKPVVFQWGPLPCSRILKETLGAGQVRGFGWDD